MNTNDNLFDTPEHAITTLDTFLGGELEHLLIHRDHVATLLRMLHFLVDTDITSLQAQLNDADRRAGAAERQLAYTLATQDKARRWMDEVKAEFGVAPNAPFDDVIDLARRYRDELRERGEREAFRQERED